MKIREFASRVVRKIAGPFVPKRLRLPFAYRVLLLDGAIEPEVHNVGDLCKERHAAIDVGANMGLWSYRMSLLYPKVYAFEINEGVARDLAAYHSDRIEIIYSGLSSETREATLYIPVKDGLALNGWASLRPGNCPDTNEHITRKVQVRPLDSYSLRGISFIKIDVEGHEVEVLRGAVETILASRPVVLVEIMEANMETVRSFFRGIDYEEVTGEDATIYQGLLAMRLFRPRQK